MGGGPQKLRRDFETRNGSLFYKPYPHTGVLICYTCHLSGQFWYLPTPANAICVSRVAIAIPQRWHHPLQHSAFINCHKCPSKTYCQITQYNFFFLFFWTTILVEVATNYKNRQLILPEEIIITIEYIIHEIYCINICVYTALVIYILFW